MRLLLVILTLHLCVGVASALDLASQFQIVFGISRTRPISVETIETEMLDWLNWLKATYPDLIKDYKDLSVVKMRSRMDIKFDLMYDDSIEDLATFFSEAYAAYNSFTIFTTYPGVRKLEYISLFGDPHVMLKYGQLKLCFDTKEGLNDVVSQYNRPDLGVRLNVDFGAAKKENRGKGKKMKWIKDVAILSPEINVVINKKFVKVQNNNDGSIEQTRWSRDTSFDIDNTIVHIDGKELTFYLFANNDSMTPEVQISIVKPGAGLNIHIMNDDMKSDAGYIATLRSHVADVVVDGDEAMLTTDFGVDVPLANHKDQCWKIPNGGHDVFPNDTFNDFIMECLDCNQPKA